jgi:uncharacterized cupin superfamily protein
MSANGVVAVTKAFAAETSQSDPDRIISGSGQATTWNALTDPTGQFFTGIWQGSPGITRVAYTEAEFCLILSGRVRLTDMQGNVSEFGTNDAFAIAPGFAGTWENIGEVSKYYAIFQPA